MKYILVFFTMLTLLSGCSVETQPEILQQEAFEQAPSEVVYNPPEQSELSIYAVRPDTLNPLLTEYSANRDMLWFIYEPLISVTQDYNINFRLAENFFISENGKKLTLNLRQNVQWHNGSIFSASDVDYTINEIIKAGDACVYYQNLRNVQSSKIVNSYTYEFTLNSPDSGFIYLLTFPIIKNTGADILTSKESFTVNGTGMYCLNEYSALKSIKLNSNSSWWNGNVNIPYVMINLLPDTSASYNGFKMNNMNTIIINHEASGKYSVNENIKSLAANTNIYSYIAVNHSNALLNSSFLRKIVKQIVSTNKITQDIIPDYSMLCNSPVHPSAQYSVAQNAPETDLKEALDKAGYIQNSSGIRTKLIDGKSYKLEFDLLINAGNPTRVITGEYIQSSLSMYGIRINLVRKNADEYASLALSQKYDLVLCETSISLNGNLSFLLASDGELNKFGFSSPEMDEILIRINTSNDLSERVGYLQKMQALFSDTMPHIPLYFRGKRLLYDSSSLSNAEIGAIDNEYSRINTWNIISGKENLQ